MASTSIYGRKPVVHLVTWLAVCVGSIVPIMSVAVLNAFENTNLKLGLMALFTLIFCIVFGFFSGAKKTELLAGSAA